MFKKKVFDTPTLEIKQQLRGMKVQRYENENMKMIAGVALRFNQMKIIKAQRILITSKLKF